MCSPASPPTPDFKGAAQEQGAANVEAARAQGKLNNPNVYSPYGAQTVSYDGDQPTITQAFSPDQQAIYAQSNDTKLKLSQLSGQGADALQGVVGKAVDFGGAPSAPGDYLTLRSQTIGAMMARPKRTTPGRKIRSNPTSLRLGFAQAPKPTTIRCRCSSVG